MSGGPPLLRVRGISKSFPGVRALDGVDLTLEPGEVLALTGENGSGKSTLAKIVYGAERPDVGTVEVDGEPVTMTGPADALRLGIVAISQELTLAPSLSVTENILMGRLPRRHGVVDWAAAHAKARRELARLDLSLDEKRAVRELSVEQQQQVEVVRAISASSRLIVLDEATSSLSERATRQLLEMIRRLSADGVAILMISHRLAELYAVATRATVLRDGRLVGDAPLPATDANALVSMMVGRDLTDLYGRRERVPGEVVLSVRDLHTSDGAVSAVDLDVRRGEILGVAGLVGSGKSELALTLAGGLNVLRGEVSVDGRTVDLTSPRTALAGGIGYVTDDRKRYGLFGSRSVSHNMSLWWRRLISRSVLIDARRERHLTAETMHRYRIRAASPRTNISTLSGGNQQKAMLARVFTLDLPVLVLNEPTRGIDVGAKAEVYGFLQDAAEAGAAIVLVSSELPELLGVTDRIVTVHQGALTAHFETHQCDEQMLGQAMLTNSLPAS